MIGVLQRTLNHPDSIFAGRPGSLVAWSFIAVVLGLLAGLIWPHQALALSSTPNSSNWITSGTPDGQITGTVYAIADNGTTIYIGGDFNYVGPNTGFGVPVVAATGSPVPTYPKVNGTVMAAVQDGAGGWYIGGLFSRVGSLARNGIAHILSNGTVDPTWNPDAGEGAVYALAVNGGTIYAGGDFSAIGGQPRQYIAALNTTTGAATSWAPQANNMVWTLAVSGSTVYVGGDFDKIGAQLPQPTRPFIAALDASTGEATSWSPSASDAVYALEVIGTTVYAGGIFSSPDGIQPSIGGQPRNYIAALNTTDSGTATSWDPNASDIVYALKVSGSVVYACGEFTAIGAQSPQPTRQHISALDIASGQATPWNPSASGDPFGTVWILDVSGTTVYAGGDFTSIGGQARNHVAALNTTDNGTATSWNPNANDAVYALSVSGSNVFAGGLLTSMGGVTRNNLASLDATTGAATSWDPNANGPVYALAVSGTKLYAGGDFTTMGGSSRLRIARFTTTTGALDSYSRNFDNAIQAMKFIGTNLYIGGDFTVISGNSLPYLAKFNSSGIIQTNWKPNPDAAVLALAGSGNTVYAGGGFTNIGSQSPQPARNYIAALNATDNGTATSWNPNASDVIWALDVSGATVYAGGSFSSPDGIEPSIGGQPRNYIAALNTTDNGTATSWNPNASATVRALVVSGTTIYAGGDFTTIGTQFPQRTRNRLAALKATDNGTVLGWNPDLNNPNDDASVEALAIGPNRLHAGGYFTSAGGASQPFLARFDGNTAVKIKSFIAKGSDASVMLSWEMGAEVESAVFRLWRSKYRNKAYESITANPIAGKGSAASGPLYSYEDKDVKPGTTYYYRLEVVDFAGESASYGPVSATVGSIVLTFPKDGAAMLAKVPLMLKWSSQGFDRFQIQVSGDSSFGTGVITIPQALERQYGVESSQWIREELYKPTSKERKMIMSLIGSGKALYWRVYGENDAGQGLTSEVGKITIK